jgi:ketopantoate hydroxymethyltransferase
MKKQSPASVETEMKQLLEKALELAKAGYWDAAIDLIEEAIASAETN